MSKRTLSRVVAKAINGDERAYSRLMRMKGKDILFVAIGIMHNKQDGEDAAQEAALVIKERIVTLKNPEAFNSWMNRVVYNVCLNIKRKEKNLSQQMPLEEDISITEERMEFLPYDYARNNEKRELIMEAMGDLTEKQRACLYMYYYEDLSYTEIAEALDIQTQDVGVTLHRSKAKLKSYIEEKDNTEFNYYNSQEKYAVPVMTLALQQVAQDTITPDMLERFEAAVIGGVFVGAGILGASSMKPLRIAVTLGVIGVLIGTVAAVTKYIQPAAESAYLNLASQEEGEKIDPLYAERLSRPRNSVDEEVSAGLSGSESNSSQETDSRDVNDFVDDDNDSDDWDDFTQSQGIVFEGSITGAEYSYSIYSRVIEGTKKKEVYISRQTEEGSVKVVYTEMGINDSLPEGKAIVDAFDAWG